MTLKTYSLQPNLVEDMSQTPALAILQTWQGSAIALAATGTHFGYVYQGTASLSDPAHPAAYLLQAGMYFCLPEGGKIGGENSSGIVVTRLNYHGMFSLGGPIEASGRFAYINGGTTSLLIPPVMLGDPCLNALYFPPGIDQTLHTHPSDRIGMIVAGQGEFETPHTVTGVEPGTIFWIPAHSLHKFHTAASGLTLVVFHPDSDSGFTHRHHPMLNRTLVDGVSAAQMTQIQTEVRSS
jgi:AraC-like ligand binding domain